MKKPVDTMLIVLILAMGLVQASSSGCNTTEPTPPETEPDTTSHNFTWTTDTFGGGSSSTLNDVFIINDNDIWAVGEIYTKDSTGQSILFPYNVAHWDGQRWTLDRITTVGLRAVFGFGPNDIWAGSSAPYHWDGQKWTGMNVTGIFDGHINGFWGRSPNDLYMVGTNGSIAHFNGSGWQRISTGTTIDIQDIWGGVNARTGEQTILAVASFVAFGRGLELLKVDGAQISRIDTAGLPLAQSSIWFDVPRRYYVAGDGLHQKQSLLDARWSKVDGLKPYYKGRVRGNHSNDVFVCGSFGLMTHYNGVSWKDYTGIEVQTFNGHLSGLSVKGDNVVAVGWKDDNAIILMGRRTQ